MRMCVVAHGQITSAGDTAQDNAFRDGTVCQMLSPHGGTTAGFVGGIAGRTRCRGGTTGFTACRAG